MGYVIRAEYTTGDSFHTEQTSMVFAYVWKDLDTAKKALQWLNEHHKYYEKKEDRWDSIKLDISDLTTKPWYKKSLYSDMWYLSIKLPGNDPDELVTESVDYHGYFETLHSLEITNEPEAEDNDLRFVY